MATTSTPRRRRNRQAEAPLDPSLLPRGTPAGDNLGVTSGRIPKVPLAGVGPLGALGQLGFHTDDAGEFHIDGLPPGVLVITAHKAGLSSGVSTALSLKAGASLDNVVITLPDGYEAAARTMTVGDATILSLMRIAPDVGR